MRGKKVDSHIDVEQGRQFGANKVQQTTLITDASEVELEKYDTNKVMAVPQTDGTNMHINTLQDIDENVNTQPLDTVSMGSNKNDIKQKNSNRMMCILGGCGTILIAAGVTAAILFTTSGMEKEETK